MSLTGGIYRLPRDTAGPENIYVDISDAVSSAEGVLLNTSKLADYHEA